MSKRPLLPLLLLVLTPAWVMAEEEVTTLDFTLPTPAGEHFRLAEHRGEEIWIAMSAPWCGDCQAFIDQVNDLLVGRAAATPTAPWRLIAITAVEEESNRGHEHHGQSAVTMLLDENAEVSRRLDPPELPWLFKVGPDGRIVAGGSDLSSLTTYESSEGWFDNLDEGLRRFWFRDP